MRHLMDNLSDKAQYKEIFAFFDKLLREYFNFEWKDVLVGDNDEHLFINELLPDEEKPVLVDEHQDFISF